MTHAAADVLRVACATISTSTTTTRFWTLKIAVARPARWGILIGYAIPTKESTETRMRGGGTTSSSLQAQIAEVVLRIRMSILKIVDATTQKLLQQQTPQTSRP